MEGSLGVYVAAPPRMKEIEGDKSSLAYQRTEWEALRKSINGLLNAANIKNIIPELFSENLIRGRGLFCRACIKSQMASPHSPMYSVVNTKFPKIGRLLVVDELIALEMLTLLLENPTNDSVEVAVGFVIECGSFLHHHRACIVVFDLFALRKAAKTRPAYSIKDDTETNLINLRKAIYLTIMSSLNFEEAGHKLLKIIKLEGAAGGEMELCNMLLECCGRMTSYSLYYALVGQSLCLMNKIYQHNFHKCFAQHYSTVHRLDTIKLTNLAMFYAHLIAADALPWQVLALVCLTEEDTTSSSHIFINLLDQRLLQHSIVPKGDHPKNARYAINFFTSIGLAGLTRNLRDYLNLTNMPKSLPRASRTESGNHNKRIRRN
ncbi:hypothetical protein SASPL_103567 [Salvia splendens]|uniref:MI domain-containing protein n=1 Tax=Salvia splendens TaxID=180675 RepID=A0A8X8YHP2_SALSN|nr:hypothetical protein SASPL_103567 [Salvia splendens]